MAGESVTVEFKADFDFDRHPPEQIWIPLPDGARLSARLYRPVTGMPVAAVVEWIPYRSSDATAIGDSMMHGWFAGHGLAALRIDIRGSGNSDGVLTDEYLSGEQDDAVAAIAWIAAQAWCNGAVGLIGISWGGFAGLQIAARRPPALKAIITACSTDDRYRDDVHYMGGALLNDGVSWGAGLFTQIARPPDPAYVGPDWRRMWQERLDGIEPPLATWLAHGERDAYWRHGSVCEDYDAIACPVFAVGGWTDGYSDALLRLMSHLKVPRRGLLGPWTHLYPNFGTPGPAIDFLAECLAWWRRWLVPEPVAADPQETNLQIWLGEGLHADAKAPVIGGRWLSLDTWPPQSQSLELPLSPARLGVADSDNRLLLVDSPQDCGAVSGEWCPLDAGGDGPEFQSDQRPDDGLSLCFDHEPLVTPIAILGAPILTLRLALDKPSALIAARLCEVTAEGRSSRVTFGLLRLKRPESVAPGQSFEAVIRLKAVGYCFAAGARIRLALSSAYWPMAWPEKDASPWVLHTMGSSLSLPLHDATDEAPAPLFGPPEAARPIAHEVVKQETSDRLVSYDFRRESSTLLVRFSRPTIAIGDLTFGGWGLERYDIRAADPAMAETTIERETWFSRSGWSIRIRTRSHLYRQAGELILKSSLNAVENDELVFERAWTHSFEKDLDTA